MDRLLSATAPHRHPLALRAVLFVLALTAAGYLFVSERNTVLQQDALPLLVSKPPQYAEALRMFADAAPLNLDQQRLQLIAATRWSAGDRAGGIALLRRVLRDEPDNQSGWFFLSQLLKDSDPAGASEAKARAERLDGSTR